MKQKPGDSTFSGFPVHVLTVTFLLTFALFLTTGWHFWKSYEEYRKGQFQEYRFQFLINALNAGPELTNLARKAANTGRLDSQNEYAFFAREISGAIQEILGAAQDAQLRGMAQELESVNNHMLEMERQAFSAVREGKPQEAQAILYGEDYVQSMRLYDRHSNQLNVEMQKRAEIKIVSLRKRVFYGLTALGLSLPLLLLIWLIALSILRRHMKARIGAEEALRSARDELEKRVDERTHELRASNERLHAQIAETLQAREALERSEAIYREAIENAEGVPYRFLFGSGHYDFVGPGVQELLGVPPGELTGELLRSITRCVVIVDPVGPKTHEEYVSAFGRGEVEQYRVDMEVVTQRGEVKWVSDCSVPIRSGPEGAVIGSLGILQDITFRKELEEQARIQQEQMIQTDKLAALGTLVSGVAHEINNPNHFILLNATALLDAWESMRPILEDYYRENGDFLLGGVNYSEMRDQAPHLFSGILEGARRIKNIVQELREFSRLDPGGHQEEVDVNAIVKSALTLMGNTIRNSTDCFSLSLCEDIPRIRGNFQRLEQVLINLIQNACQALSGKQCALHIQTHVLAHRGCVCVEVRDGGVGIPAENRKRIFDPFFTTRRESGGVGLGLSISSTIMSQHGGRLEIDSREGEGTTALVLLPIPSA